MGSLLSAPLACVGTMLGSCASTALCKACSCACIASSRAASHVYVALLALAAVTALFFEQYGGDIVLGGGYNATADSYIDKMRKQAMGAPTEAAAAWWNQRFWCAARHPHGWVVCCEDTCGGVFSVYRFSWTLCLFFASMTLITLGTTRVGAKAHRGFWFAKVFALVGTLVASLFVSNDAMVPYREVARYMSFFFLAVQILLLVDFGYSWNEKWLAYDEESDSDSFVGWRLAIVVSAFVLYAASIVGWALMYAHFGHGGCPAQQTVISLALIGSLLLTGVSISRIAPHGTLLTSAVVTSYTTYLAYSALASHPDAACNPFAEDGDASTVVVGLVVAAISVASTAWNAAGSKAALLGTSEVAGSLEESLDKGAGAGDDAAAAGGGAADEVEPESWWYFHVMMCACSLYLSMLLTDWSRAPAEENGVPVSGSTPIGKYSVGLESFWVKVISLLVCFGLYGWTLLAPYLLREYRDFGIEFDF